MPSGAKKRKAAKKKEKNHSHNATNPSSASTRSNDDVRHQDDKDSNVGEVSSPSSQDHRNHLNVLTEGDEEETKKEENALQIEGEFKIEERDAKIQQDELSSSSNSASNSDDESRGITNNPAVEDYSAAVNSVEATDLLSETPRTDEITLCVEKTKVKSSSEAKVGISDPKEF